MMNQEVWQTGLRQSSFRTRQGPQTQNTYNTFIMIDKIWNLNYVFEFILAPLIIKFSEICTKCSALIHEYAYIFDNNEP